MFATPEQEGRRLSDKLEDAFAGGDIVCAKNHVCLDLLPPFQKKLQHEEMAKPYLSYHCNRNARQQKRRLTTFGKCVEYQTERIVRNIKRYKFREAIILECSSTGNEVVQFNGFLG